MNTMHAYLARALRRTAAVGLLVLLASAAAEAQVPAAPQNRPIALVGGTIHTITGGVIENGTIVFDGGVITAIGRNVTIPAGAERVDVSDKHVYPGLVDGHTNLGLFEIGGFDVTIDMNELGSVNPNARAVVAVNPESRHHGVARSNGILVAITGPSGGLISGQAGAIMLDGWTWEQMALEMSAGLVVNWPNPMNENNYDSTIKELRDVFAEARAYRTAHRAVAAGNAPRRDTDPRWDAMIPVLDGEVPVIVNANELRQLQDAIAWADDEGVRIVLRGGRDAVYVADHLARKEIPVILTTVLGSPNRGWEPYDAVYGAPAALHRAGVRFAISGSASAAYVNRLPYEAGAAIAYGLPEDEAVKAVTLYPAQIFGIDDRVGSLEVGKHATLMITTGNPVEYATVIEQAYIQGRKIDMVDAHRGFFEKYMEKVRQTRAADATTTNN